MMGKEARKILRQKEGRGGGAFGRQRQMKRHDCLMSLIKQ
jgi:hypothetical protein